MNRIIIIISSIFFLFNCSSNEQAIDNFSSPKSLFVDHINSFTGGVISVGNNIRLKLTKSIPDSLVGTSLDNIFDFSPNIEGSASWEDNKTIVFQPSTNLVSNQKYEATVNLKTIIPEIDDDKKEFKFIFQTLIQNYEIAIGGLKLYNSNDLTKVKIEGTIQTADIVDFENVKKIISASQSGESLNISWVNPSLDNTFNFIVENVSRGDSEGEVELQANGSPIEVKKEETLEVEIPSLSDYKVISSRIVRGEDNFISVLFSDPLDARQNLTGMVALSGTNNRHRLVIDLNELKIYPTQEITSDASLTINTGIKNIAGYKLKEEYVTTLQFTQTKPEVRLVDANAKSILPNSNGLILPFEAVGLKAVDVTVIRIFEDNMQQYLQVNGLGGQSQLSRVGRPIVKKTIPLNTSGVTNLNAWNRFTLNLEDILTTEPGAFYKIQIGFQKRHSLYFCTNNDQIESIEDEGDEWGAEEEGSYWDSYEYYYNPGYNWEERDNPCSDSYYGNRRSISKMLMASDFGIIAKRRDNGEISVFVTNLINTEPISGVSVEIYDYQQQLLNSDETDGDGKVKIDINKPPFVLVAKKGNQIGYLKLDDGSALSLSNFDVTGNTVQKGLKGFIYGERGVWRPADTVHLSFILENLENKLPENHPVVMELHNPNGQLAFRKIRSEAVGNIYRFDFITEHDAPTGNWQATAKIGGASFHKTVKIETIKPNRLKINLTFDKEKFSANDNTVSGDLNVRWLSGAKAKNLKAEYELLLKPVKTTFKGFPNFSFDDQSKEYYSSKELVFEGNINSEGYAKVNIDLGDANDAPGALTAKLFGKVYEEGGDFSVNNTSIPYFPYSSYVGVKTPEGDKRGILLTDEDHEVKIATVDADGNPISRSGVKVELYKLNWKWWWDNSYEYISNYVGRSYSDPISKGTINTRNGSGKWKLRINHPEWGRYYLKVEDPVSGHSSGQIVYLDWPGWAGKGKRGELDGASMLDFAIEKTEYKVGDQIALSIPSTTGNRILVSLETGSKVLQTFWVKTEEGNTTISFEATSEMAPNIYAHLTMVQPHGQTTNDLPIRLYGVQSIKVVDKETELNPVVKLPAELRPEQKFDIEISEKSGRPMAYTIAVVDEGLLDITNYKTPKPWDNFYAREALGIKTWDVYDDVMGAFSGKMDYLLAIGGDDEIKAKEENEASRFKPVVIYLGPYYLKKGEKRKHKVKMPQYIGSVKTMVVAASDGAYGSTDVATPVKQPLMVLATLPRVAGPGESMKLPVNIFALKDNVGDVSISVEATGALALSGSKTSNVKFSKSGDKVIFFDIKAKEALGVGKVKVTAKSGKLEATYDIEMNIIPRNPVTSDITDKVISSGESWNHNYQPMGMLGENNAYVEISTLPPLNIEQRLGYLIRYPHGCIEQTTSSVFAQLFLDKLMTLPEKREKEVQRNIEAAIKRLKSFQLSSGGFAYWPGNDFPNNWGSNYAGHFLLEAKKAGYLVPEGMLSSWIGFQSSKADAWGTLSSDDDNDLIQAYRLYCLALAGNPSLGAMNRMKESSGVRREAKWRLALAYAASGYDKQAIKLIDGLSIQADSTLRDYRYSFGSAIRDKAMIMETLLHLDQKEKAFEILMEIAGEMGKKDKWMSTQTTAYSFIAIAKYAANFDLDNETNTTVDIAGNIKNIKSNNFIDQLTVNDPDEKALIGITNNGATPVFARIIRIGIPLEGTEESINRNIKFNVQYTDMNGSPVNISSLPQGTNFKAQVTVTNPGLKGIYNELALTQIFPSGWEIINTRLEGSDSGDQYAEYIDIRDDRTMHYFDLKPNQTATFDVQLNAAYQGNYYLPSVSVEAMYDNSIFANKKGKWVKVVPEN
ncbi:MAG: MG2 domain-containing protein [Cyclobacteriaceae bacterium]|nr:MG2 domain-containing protein [Cyclobacteriaceae bacterium]